PKPSSEVASRDARYRFLTATAQRIGARYVAVAHTADDQAETVLHHILRGTGLAGLSGMPRARELADGVALAPDYNPQIVDALLRLSALAADAQELIVAQAKELADRSVVCRASDRLVF